MYWLGNEKIVFDKTCGLYEKPERITLTIDYLMKSYMGEKQNKFSVECTFGDGPDVLVNAKDLKIMLMENPDYKRTIHGVVGSWQLDLTVNEAEELSKMLYEKAQIAKNLYNGLK